MSVREHIKKKSNESLISRVNIDKNKELVAEIMSMSLRDLESIDDIDLSRYIIALSQYVVFLRKQVNYANLKYFLNKRQFEEIVSEGMLTQQGKTVKEKREKTVRASAELRWLQETMDKYEAEKILLDKMDDSIIHYINALKKEQTRRDNERYTSRRERS
jgi:hypothetical protein